jgi:hypothetical protein
MVMIGLWDSVNKVVGCLRVRLFVVVAVAVVVVIEIVDCDDLIPFHRLCQLLIYQRKALSSRLGFIFRKANLGFDDTCAE